MISFRTAALTAIVFHAGMLSVSSVQAADSEAAAAVNPASCGIAGPQAPRDITSKAGASKVVFGAAPAASDMRLCDIHFHKFAEHKAAGYATLFGEGANKGYICNGTKPVATKASDSHSAPAVGCGGVAAGDTVEVHWVYTTCNVDPAPTLGSCFSKTCSNPQLRVEARVFHLTDGDKAADFSKYATVKDNQAAFPPSTTAVQYQGSTTGDKLNDGTCSPYSVTWSVDPACSDLKLASLNNWCGKGKNVFDEDHAHGVRRLVTEPSLLSLIK